MFLSTRSEVGVYKFILNACIKNYERLLKKKIEILIFEKKKFPSLKYFFFSPILFYQVKFSEKIVIKLHIQILKLVDLFCPLRFKILRHIQINLSFINYL